MVVEKVNCLGFVQDVSACNFCTADCKSYNEQQTYEISATPG